MSRYLAIGSVCWDVIEGDEAPRLGGSVLFATRVAQGAGWEAAIVTSGTPRLEAALREALPGVDITVQPSATDTVFWFSRQTDLGPLRLDDRAAPIDVAALDHHVEAADVVHLAPIMGEVTPPVVAAARRGRFVGITPQGLLRETDPDTGALVRLHRLDAWWAGDVAAAVLSEDEYELVAHPESLDPLALAVTRGERGCVGRLHGGDEVDVAGIEVGEIPLVGTIGAGDTFAAAFFMALASGVDFDEALRRANRRAASHVSGDRLPY